jgi:predicted NUDIX family phosphoesterase
LEFVLVVPRHHLFTDRYPHGFEPLDDAGRASYLQRIHEHGYFVERRHAEEDKSLKQIIPYALFERGGEVFLMRRLGSGGEARLHGKLSVGVGGHINPVDGAEDALEAGLQREIDEEVDVAGPWDATPVGILNDDSTAVGAVHFGLVYRVSTKADVTIREQDALEGGFTAKNEVLQLLSDERDRFETWSALLLDRLDELI